MINALEMMQTTLPVQFNRSKIIHAGTGEDGHTLCGRSGGWQGGYYGEPVMITCKRCLSISERVAREANTGEMIKESDARIADATRGEVTAPSVVMDVAPWDGENGPDLANLDEFPRDCYFGDTADVVGVFFDYVGNVEGVCARHAALVQRPVTMFPEDAGFHETDVYDHIPFGRMQVATVFTEFAGEPVNPDFRQLRPFKPIPGMSDESSFHAVIDMARAGECNAYRLPDGTWVLAHVTGEGEVLACWLIGDAPLAPYVVEGRVMIKIPGLKGVELDEGTEQFVITPGYSDLSDCAHMTSIKRYGRRNPNVRVTHLRYIGLLNR
jgi:hypothetical protein